MWICIGTFGDVRLTFWKQVTHSLNIPKILFAERTLNDTNCSNSQIRDRLFETIKQLKNLVDGSRDGAMLKFFPAMSRFLDSLCTEVLGDYMIICQSF